MRKNHLFLLIVSFSLFLSCSKDEEGFIEDIGSNPEEETILNPASISRNLVIIGSSKVSGVPPAPNGTLDFAEIASAQQAYLKHGLTVALPDGNYTGAYLQVKSADGVFAPDYHEIPITANSRTTITQRNRSFGNSQSQNNTNRKIDIHLKDSQTPGKFCFLLSLHDDSGNVSQPQEVCITIEAWGGNPNLVSNWEYAHVLEDGKKIALGEDHSCTKDRNFDCGNQETLSIEKTNCQATILLELNIRADGTYDSIETYKSTKQLNQEASINNCNALYNEDSAETTIQSAGRWAYNEEEKTITFIEFDTNDPFELDYGDLLFTRKVSATPNDIAITVENTTITSDYHFVRQ